MTTTNRDMAPNEDEAPARVQQSGVAAGSILLVATFVAGIANYVFNIVCIRWVGATLYADVAAMTALSMMALLPCAGLQAAYARATAHAVGRADADRPSAIGDYGVHRSFRYQLWLLAASLLAAGAAAVVLDFERTSVAFLLPLLVLGGALTPIVSGVLQGIGRFGSLAFVMTVGSAARVLLVIPLILVASEFGAVLAGGLGNVVAAVAGLILMRHWLPRRAEGAVHIDLDVTVRASVIALLAFSVLSNADILIANAVLDNEGSGLYAAVVLVGKAIAYAASAISMVVLTSTARRAAAGHDTTAVVRKTALSVGGMGAALALTCLFVPESIFESVLGIEDLGERLLIPAAVAAMTLVGVVNLLLSHALGLAHTTYVRVIVACTTAYVVLAATLATSPLDLLSFLIGASLVCIAGYPFASRRDRDRAHAPGAMSEALEVAAPPV